jgi:anti-anti-sigma factor
MSDVAKIEVLQTNNVLVKILVKNFDLHNASKIRAHLKDVLEDDERENVIFDMTLVESLDSTGISILAMASSVQRKKGKQVFLVGANQKINQILVISSMMNLFKVANDVKSADGK